MSTRTGAVIVLLLLTPLLGSACITSPSVVEVQSLDLAQCAEDEGIVVVRFFTSLANEDDLDHVERDPDLTYSVRVRDTKARWNMAAPETSLTVASKEGPALFVRKLKAGDHYFDELRVRDERVSFPITVKFTAQPGRITYVGDLSTHFVEGRGFLMNPEWRCRIEVGGDPFAVRRELEARFGLVPAMEVAPMTIEDYSLL